MRSSGSNPVALTADTDGDCVAIRLPEHPSDSFAWGSRLKVKKRQQAVLGPPSGWAPAGWPTVLFASGNYDLTPSNISQLAWYATQTAERQAPFRATLTFLTTDPIADLQWQDKLPLYVRDVVLGQIPIRVQATFTALIKDSCRFSQTTMGEHQQYTCEDLGRFCQDYLLRPAMVKAVETLNRPIHLLHDYRLELADALLFQLGIQSLALGLEVTDLDIGHIKIPATILKCSTKVGPDRHITQAPQKHGLYGTSPSMGLGMVVPRSLAKLVPDLPGSLPEGAVVQQTALDPISYLEHLATLRDRGLLSQSELEQHKYRLLQFK